MRSLNLVGALAAMGLAFLSSIPLAAAEPTAAVLLSSDSSGFRFKCGDDTVEVALCLSNLAKVTVTKPGKAAVDTLSIAKTHWDPVSAVFETRNNAWVLRTSRLIVTADRATGLVGFSDRSGQMLVAEAAPDGVYQTWQKGIQFRTRPGSHFYGLRGWAYLDDSKGQMELAPSAQPYAIQAGAEGYTGGPFLWSNRGYGLFLNTDSGYCHIASDTSVRFYDLTGDAVSYYVAVGSPYAVQAAVAELSGRPPLFPKWALGFSNSEFADMNEARCEANVAGYRSRGIPTDLYTFDFQWKAWGDDHYGEFRWNPVNFPNGPSGAFARRMRASGIKLAGIMKPRILVDSEEGRYATAHGFWVKGREPYDDYFCHKLVNDLDFSIPECRAWFWEHCIPAFDSGIVGWWNDEADAWGSTWEFLNMARALYDGQRAHTHDRVRVWTNNRNFFSGAQRYAYATWSGDIESGFSVMQQQRERLLSSVNVGQARWGMDTGGFNNNYHISGEELDECFARWMEFAAFVPIFRTHGTSYRQPWLYGARAEAAARRAGRLRYSLLPYTYSLEAKLHQTGVGLVRPLVWDYPDDPQVANDVEAWMFGDAFLVAPIVERGQRTKTIYLPPGTWFDYFRGDRHEGGRTIFYAVTPDSWNDIPLFVKAGAIIPTVEVMNYVGERPVTNVTVEVYPSAASSRFDYYDDDGESYDYERGVFFRQTLGAQAGPEGVTLTVGPRTGTFAPALRWYTFRVHAPGAGPAAVKLIRVPAGSTSAISVKLRLG